MKSGVSCCNNDYANKSLKKSLFSFPMHKLPKNGLANSTEKLIERMISLQFAFNVNNGDGLLISEKYLKTHVEKALGINCNIKV